MLRGLFLLYEYLFISHHTYTLPRESGAKGSASNNSKWIFISLKRSSMYLKVLTFSYLGFEDFADSGTVVRSKQNFELL